MISASYAHLAQRRELRCVVSGGGLPYSQPMRRRYLIACVCVLGLLCAPAAALAQGGGGSAGDQQYTDPLAGTTTGSQTQPASTTPASSPTTTSAPATSTPSSTTPGSPTSSGQATTSAPATSDSAAPTATTASGTTDSQKTLPFTGINLFALAGVGLGLTASGLLIRIRARA